MNDQLFKSRLSYWRLLTIATFSGITVGILFLFVSDQVLSVSHQNLEPWLSLTVTSLVSLFIGFWPFLKNELRQGQYFQAFGRLLIVVVIVVPISFGSGVIAGWLILMGLLSIWDWNAPTLFMLLAIPPPFIVTAFIAAFTASEARVSQPRRRV